MIVSHKVAQGGYGKLLLVQTNGRPEEEYPVRFWTEEMQPLEILEIEDRWYSTGVTYFKVFADNARHYILVHDNSSGSWQGKEVQI